MVKRLLSYLITRRTRPRRLVIIARGRKTGRDIKIGVNWSHDWRKVETRLYFELLRNYHAYEYVTAHVEDAPDGDYVRVTLQDNDVIALEEDALDRDYVRVTLRDDDVISLEEDE